MKKLGAQDVTTRKLGAQNVSRRYLGATLVWDAAAASPIITAPTQPVLAALVNGNALSTAVTWGSYESTAGTISTPTTKEMSVNGGAYVAYDGATIVDAGDSYQLRETVTDSAGTDPVQFVSGAQTV